MQELDLEGLKCPLPVLKIQKALASLAEGESVSVLVTDPMAAIDVPHFCNEKGHHLQASEQLEGGRLHFIIKKGGGKAK